MLGAADAGLTFVVLGAAIIGLASPPDPIPCPYPLTHA
jgi:hypothetical protein